MGIIFRVLFIIFFLFLLVFGYSYWVEGKITQEAVISIGGLLFALYICNNITAIPKNEILQEVISLILEPFCKNEEDD